MLASTATSVSISMVVDGLLGVSDPVGGRANDAIGVPIGGMSCEPSTDPDDLVVQDHLCPRTSGRDDMQHGATRDEDGPVGTIGLDLRIRLLVGLYPGVGRQVDSRRRGHDPTLTSNTPGPEVAASACARGRLGPCSK